MSYCSKWQLVGFGKARDVDAFKRWLRAETKAALAELVPCPFDGTMTTTDRANVLERIVDCFETRKKRSEFHAGFHYEKCYQPWDEVIAMILDYGRSHGLDMGYGRIGEDPSDLDFNNGDGAWVRLNQQLEEPRFPAEI